MNKNLHKDPTDVMFATLVYRELGHKVRKLEEYEKSLKFFDVALQKSPHDLRALQGRSLCRAQLCHFKEAMMDCQTMLEAHPENIGALTMKSIITYLTCEFEDSMVQNVRLQLLRKKPDNFIVGVMHCHDAIQNCIGMRAGVPLRDHFTIVRKIAWTNTVLKPKNPQPKKKTRKSIKPYWNRSGSRTVERDVKKEVTQKVSAMLRELENRSVERPKFSVDSAFNPFFCEKSVIRESLNSSLSSSQKIPPHPPYPFKPIQNYTTNIENFMAERYLDRMWHDKNFLKRIMNDPGVYCHNDKVGNRIMEMARKSHNHVYLNQEVLRNRRPFYFLRFQDSKMSGKVKERQDQRINSIQRFCRNEAEKFVVKIKKAIDNWNYREITEHTTRLYEFCKNTEKKYLPEREAYLQKMYALARDASYMLKTPKKSMTPLQYDGRIAVLLGLPKSRQPSVDSFAKQIKEDFRDKKKQSCFYEDRVKKATSIEELIWLYFQLSGLNYDLKNYEIAKSYSTKCVREADLVKELKWEVNAIFQRARCQVALKNYNAAKTELKTARKMAKSLDDSEIEDFVNQCTKVLNQTPLDGMEEIEKTLSKRAERILNLLRSDELKKDASHLFNRMSAMPNNRRLVVVPGVHLPHESSVKSNTTVTSLDGLDEYGSETRRTLLKLLDVDIN